MHTCLTEVNFASMSIVEEKSSNFARKIHIYLWNNFPRATKGLKSKRKKVEH
jgi:hypothetical protein